MSHTIIRIDSAPVKLSLFAAQGPGGPAGPAGTTTWSGITGKPTEFPPSAHTHVISDVVSLQTTLNLKAPLASPALTGTPTAPTAATTTNTSQLATTAFVQQELTAGTALAKNLEVFARNETGATLTKGTIVYINGTTGNRPTVTKAQANNDANSAQTIGFVKVDIAHNADGFVIVSGELENVNTGALTGGQQLYLSTSVAGAWTTTKPSAPNHLVYVGIVVRANNSNGIIYVSIQNGYELEELHDVAISTPAAKQVIKRNAGNTLWVNEAIVSADVSDAASAATPSTLVVRTSGGAASFTGITNNGALTLSTGTTFTYGAGIAAAHRTALGLGSLATQSGTFSGTHSGDSSGTNTGDQDLSGLLLSMITVSGILDPFSNPIAFNGIEQATLSNGKRRWVTADLSGSLEWDAGVWTLGSIEGYEATNSSSSDAPWKLTGWEVNTGSGQPSFTIDPPALLPVNASGTIALSTDQQGRVSPADMIGFGSGVFNGLISDINNNGGFLTAGTGGTLPITRGGTGATTAGLARTNLGATATGTGLFVALDPAAARTTLGVISRVTTADVYANSTTPVAIPQLTFPVEANKLYKIDFGFAMQSWAAPGYQVTMNHPNLSRTGNGYSQILHSSNIKTVTLGATSTLLNRDTAGNPNGTMGMTGYAYIRPTASGNVTFTTSHQSAGSTLSIGPLAGSGVLVTELYPL